ncbi:MAG: bifunctional adenosylcobinamide kinase/adenosylcobinamide-phosphate guanylyltransferase [Candidatus Binataceae bacterium]
MGTVTLITGGARSGKSAHALKLAMPYPRKCFIATAEARDEEMAARIAHHRAGRSTDFRTIEEPSDVAAAIAKLGGETDAIVLDCVTLWISNLMAIYPDDAAIIAEADRLAGAIHKAPFASIVVTDEAGAGIVPDNAMARRFRDLLGWANQKLAAAADEVILMVAGIPLKVK